MRKHERGYHGRAIVVNYENPNSEKVLSNSKFPGFFHSYSIFRGTNMNSIKDKGNYWGYYK